ncbi:porphobilinogen synthase [Salibacter sp.]|uniref:porphobilinogen synthase n=1 Tax=Salibacter sp. TaxID=2010995 RepID=UPI0028703FD6|nr:porphobilinogen synthase [Salibacter sp.]MDR9487848.1 porphobilinogen synthase [Salibacter sp.]
MTMTRRPRRNRKNEAVRAMMRETRLTADNLVYPMFIVDGENQKQEISSLQGNYRWSVDLLVKEVEECMKLGLRNFMFFPKVEEELKDEIGSYSYDPDNFYLSAFRTLKKHFPEINIITDVALDPYSSDGHDGIVKDGKIVNDETNIVLAKMAIEQARAGADIIGPSDMMDGRVEAIRNALDEEGFEDVSIMSYTAKYASAFYGPFRDALDSAPKESSKDIPKDKKTYQMDPANKREALLEADLDYMEGADFMMVKPATFYLDIIHMLKSNYDLPIAAYNVSGEIAMLKAACEKGWLDYNTAMPEMLLSIKRAGADVIISYLAKDYCELVK